MSAIYEKAWRRVSRILSLSLLSLCFFFLSLIPTHSLSLTFSLSLSLGPFSPSVLTPTRSLCREYFPCVSLRLSDSLIGQFALNASPCLLFFPFRFCVLGAVRRGVDVGGLVDVFVSAGPFKKDFESACPQK